jgi:hypothetical protein
MAPRSSPPAAARSIGVDADPMRERPEPRLSRMKSVKAPMRSACARQHHRSRHQQKEELRESVDRRKLMGLRRHNVCIRRAAITLQLVEGMGGQSAVA